MKTQRLMMALTALNLLIMIVLLAKSGSTAQADPSVVRAQAIELVDAKGSVRAQLNVEESGETVFRLRDENGTIRVKIGASEDGSGLLLANNATEPGVHMLAKRSGTSLTLTGKDGEKRVITP